MFTDGLSWPMGGDHVGAQGGTIHSIKFMSYPHAMVRVHPTSTASASAAGQQPSPHTHQPETHSQSIRGPARAKLGTLHSSLAPPTILPKAFICCIYPYVIPAAAGFKAISPAAPRPPPGP